MRPPGWRAAGPKCSLSTPTPVSGRLFSSSPTRFFTEGSGTSAASEPTWGGEIGKLRSVNLVHFIFLDHFSKGREQQSQRNLNTLSWTGGEKRREEGKLRGAREVGGNRSACVPSPALPAGQLRDSSWDFQSRASESVIHAPLHFTLPFLHPCPLVCSIYAVRPPTRMKAKNITDKLATALPLARTQGEAASDWVLATASEKRTFAWYRKACWYL